MLSSSFSQAVKIFFSYNFTSPKDTQLFNRLKAHLSVLRRQHLIDEWYDSAISPGNHVTQTLEAHLRAAQIIVLLISAEFVASDRCYELEMKRALELSEAGTARLIPVLLSPIDWEALPLSRYHPLPEDGKSVSLQRNREQAFSEIARGIRKVIEELAKRAKKLLTFASAPESSLYHLPYRQNAFFTDRESILATLTSSFTFTQSRQTTILALNGLGGIGKTQIALEYLYRSSHLYQTTLWLNASSRESLSAEISAIAEKLALPERVRMDEDQLFATLRQWLQGQKTWLLVLDNIEDLTLIDLIVPPQSSGHVLLTTQTQATGGIAPGIHITPLEIEASVLFFLQRAQMLPLNASLEQASPESVRLASAITQAMDNVPLALDQAAAYLEETGCGLAAYLELFQQERAALLIRRGRIANNQNHPDSVAITLALTFEKVKQRRPMSLRLLYLLAFLSPEAIPYEMLIDGSNELSGPLRTLTAHPLTLNEALADLHSYSLVQHLADSTMLRMHRIVQAVLIDALTPGQQRQWASQVARLVNRIFPEAHFDNWAECERYLSQAQHCATLIRDFRLTLKEGALLLQRLGSYCYRQARYTEAEIYLTQALEMHEQRQWSDALEHAQTLNSLALLAYKQARYQEAEKFHRRALALREATLGPAHPQTAESLHNLALLYGQQGGYQEAEQLYIRALAIEEQAFGPQHPESAKTLNNLGLVYYEQGRFAQAEAAYLRALTIYEDALPKHHPDAMYPLDGLGAIAERRADYQNAEHFYQRALSICEQAFGDEHPETAHSLNKLADILETRGKDRQAEQLYQRALSIGEQTLGENHPDVALFLNNLAFLAEKRGNYQQAEQLYQRALTIYEQALGAEHPTVADVLNNLGLLAKDTHNEERAEELLRRALAVREQTLGAEHPDTAQSLSNLAELLTSRRAYAEAEPLFQRALALRQHTFGPQHPDVTLTREKYATLLEQMRRNEEAARLREDTQTRKEPPTTE